VEGPTETNLWHRSLGAECASADSDRYRTRLVSALDGFRERAALLAGEIARDHPDFTIHDKSHFDALWCLADLILGPDYDLTPTEAFVFGSAALVHDLGMAAAAYVDGSGGPDSLREDPRFADKVAFVLRDRLERVPSPAEIESADPSVVREATSALLRELHAERAEWLVKASWEAGGTRYSLLEDSGLRDAYGPVIGLIAHSHWWSTAAIGDRLKRTIGAPASAPSTWTVRPLVIACLLRLADASHLDASRAPRFLQALRQVNGTAKEHWDFQARLAQPFRRDDRLVFTSSPFSAEEASAWWLCADTLKGVDKNFLAVDILLADHGEARFAARGIDGVHDLERLGEHLPTDGWLPIEASVSVSDVVSLVRGLGGEQLYGEAPHVPLRELMQNGADAVRARRIIESRDPDWGRVVVRLGKDPGDGKPWLEVEDTGVGMSPEVLAKHLLDFGTSFWGSESVTEELPGLISQGFEATGRFGIGFFSVFMWSEVVTVTSRKHDAASSDTYVMEFRHGLQQRPIVRRARDEERMVEPGTRVRVQVDVNTLLNMGFAKLLYVNFSLVNSLASLCSWLAPALDVTLEVEAGHLKKTVSLANDWLSLRPYEVAMRIRRNSLTASGGASPENFVRALEEIEPQPGVPEGHVVEIRDPEIEPPEPGTPSAERSPLEENGRLLHASNGKVAGHALLDPIDYNGGVVAIGGFNAGYLRGISGIILGTPLTASRHKGVAGVSPASLANWASEQAKLLSGKLFAAREFEGAAVVRACGGDTGPLPVALTSSGWLNKAELSSWVAERDKILLVQEEEREFRGESKRQKPEQDMVITSSYARRPFASFGSFAGAATVPDLERELCLADVVLKAVDAAWGTAYHHLGHRQLVLASVRLDVSERDDPWASLFPGQAAWLSRDGVW